MMKETIQAAPTGESRPSLRLIEIILAILGGMNCAFVAVVFAIQELSLRGAPGEGLPITELWPFPAIYFLEILFLGLATAYFVTTNRGSTPPRWDGLPWISAGILLAFVIVGAFTIGLYLIPAMLSFLIAGILGDRRQAGNWPTHVIFFLFSAMAQAVAVYLLLLLFR